MAVGSSRKLTCNRGCPATTSKKRCNAACLLSIKSSENRFVKTLNRAILVYIPLPAELNQSHLAGQRWYVHPSTFSLEYIPEGLKVAITTSDHGDSELERRYVRLGSRRYVSHASACLQTQAKTHPSHDFIVSVHLSANPCIG